MKQTHKVCRRVSAVLALFLLTAVFSGAAKAQTSAFTYQGRLTDGGAAANGVYDLGFALYDAETGGNQIGAAATRNAVNVANGIFTVSLDFGASPFASGANRFLEIAVKHPADTSYTTLTPRQQLTAAPFSIQSLSAKTADGLSANCVGCVTNAQINSVDGAKVTGTVASATTAQSATTATTAGNVSGIVAIANGGTGSSTKNFVDTTTAQTVGGNKTFSSTVSANLFSAGSGGAAMNNNFLRLKASNDNNHGILYNSTIDGMELRANIGYRWVNGTNGATERMRLDGSGNLTVGGNITATGTISGTLANDSVGGAQIADGSLRLSDIAVLNSTVALPALSLGAHGCATLSLNGFGEVGDIVNVYLANTTPVGIYVRPTTYTTAGTAVISFCNTLNTNNSVPAQTVRVIILRP